MFNPVSSAFANPANPAYSTIPLGMRNRGLSNQRLGRNCLTACAHPITMSTSPGLTPPSLQSAAHSALASTHDDHRPVLVITLGTLLVLLFPT